MNFEKKHTHRTHMTIRRMSTSLDGILSLLLQCKMFLN